MANDPHGRVCPASGAAFLATPLRRLFNDPDKILAGLIHEGETVVDLGCGPGFFTIPMAKMVGDSGCVIAVDIQSEMLAKLQKRAEREGLMERIKLHQSEPNRIGVITPADFALAFYMVHEVPDAEGFLREITSFLKPGGRFLLVEPKVHVSARAFSRTVEIARSVGLKPIGERKVFFSRSVLFERS